MEKSFWRYSVFLKILGGVALLGIMPFAGDLIVISAFTIIGLPIAILIFVAPMLFLVLIMIEAIRKYLKMNWYFGLFLVVGLLVIPPFLINNQTKIQAKILLAGDIDNLPSKPKLTSLAVLYTTSYGRKNTCDDFCQRALLNGQADKMIMARVKSPIGAIDWDMEAQAFWFEQRKNCPSVEVDKNRNNLRLKNKDTGMKNGYEVTDFIKLEASKGNCLISETVKFGDANAALIYGRINHGKTAYAASYNLFADVNNANRLTFYQKINGKMSIIFQSTAVVSRPLIPILLFTQIGGYGLNLGPGFMRDRQYLGVSAEYHETINLPVFLENRLHLKLNVSGSGLVESIKTSVFEILDKDGMLNDSEVQLIYEYLEIGKYSPYFNEINGRFAIRVLNDKRVPIAPYTYSLIKKFNQGNDEFLRYNKILIGMSAALFKRLKDFKSDPLDENFSTKFAQLRNIATAIYELPDFAIQPHSNQLIELAHDEEKREQVAAALRKLHVFERDGLPTILYLWDKMFNRMATKTFDAAFYNLCMLGKNGFSDVVLRDKIHKKLDNSRRISGNFKIAKLLYALGDKPDEIFKRLEFSDNKTDRFAKSMANHKNNLNCEKGW